MKADTTSIQPVTVKKKRDSNLELFRIVLMMLIIAHHYVVCSGMLSLLDFNHVTGNMVFLQTFAMFGKAGINAFTLITGYFMVKSRPTVLRFLRVYLEVKFYELLFYLIFQLTGYTSFSWSGLLTSVFSVAYNSGRYYTASYLTMYLMIPLMNVLVRHMNKKQYQYLLAVLIGYFTVLSTFFFRNTFSFVGWLMTLYLIGGYIAMYPSRATESRRVGLWGMIISIVLMFASILTVDFVGVRFGFETYDYMYSDANKVLALTCAVFAFLFFKNIKIKYNPVINRLAEPIFGILQIHTHSVAMNILIWIQIFHSTDYYTSQWLIPMALFEVVTVYLVCWALDELRIKYLERPLMRYMKKSSFIGKMDRAMEEIL